MRQIGRRLHMYRTAVQCRPGRALALLLAVFVAATGFTVLTASSSDSRLAVTGSVNDMARLNYDILVRPTNAKTAVERDRSLIQSGYLSGVPGGISIGQWHTIEHLQGVDVAAPIAMLGYVVPQVDIPVDVAKVPTAAGDAGRNDVVVRQDVTWRYDNGLSAERAVPDFAFMTRQHLTVNTGDDPFNYFYGPRRSDRLVGPYQVVETLGKSQSDRPSYLGFCSADGSGSTTCADTGTGVGPTITFAFPMLLAAVDPVAEAELTGLGTGLTSGQPLTDASLRNRYTATRTVTPVLTAAGPSTELHAEVTLSQVNAQAVQKVLHGAGAPAMRRLPHGQQGSVKVTVDGTDAYQRLLTDFSTIPHHGPSSFSRWLLPSAIAQRFVITTPDYRDQGGVLVPQGVDNDVTRDLKYQGFSTWAPAGMGDFAVRGAESVEGPEGRGGLATPSTVKVVGILPTDTAAKLGDVTSQILSGITATDTTGADQRSRNLLSNKPLAPSPNMPGLVQPPPLMITTLAATDQWYKGWSGAGDPTNPISAIRVRVAGVTGIDDVSRERVRLAAQQIQAATGLDVDITLGASATNVQIENPAGRFGRPELLLEQQWVKKGVATSVIRALDKKSLAIFVLVLLVSGLTVANSTIASVRARRTEFGVLACLGWKPRQIAGAVLGEVTLLASVAGVLSVAAALGIGHLVSTPVSPTRAALALPAALVVALVAAVIPVWQAGRASPMGAIHPPVATPRRAVAVRSLRRLAMVNVGRNKVRTGLAAAGLAVAVAAATFLAVISLSFRGAVVGTLLGDAVAVQVRAADYAAVGATLLLAMLGVGNVMYLNIRERGVELATLAALGWSAVKLNTVIWCEALIIGLIGTFVGVAVGATGATLAFGNVSLPPMVGTVALASIAGIGVTVLATAAASQLVRRLSIAAVLAEE